MARGAAPPAGPACASWGADPRIALEPIFADELARWSAGAIVTVALTNRHAVLIFECPDGSGGLALWLQEDEPNLVAHVDLPTAQVIRTAQSPDRSRLAVVDAQGRTVVVTTTGTASDHLQILSLAHSQRILAIGLVHGLPASAGCIVCSMDAAGCCCISTVQSSFRVSDSELATKVTLLHACSTGESTAAFCVHPVLPVVALATVSGVLQLLDVGALVSATPEKAVLSEHVLCLTTKTLSRGVDKVLEWSPDGKMLAAADCTTGTVTFFQQKQHMCKADWISLSLLGSIAATHVTAIRWYHDVSKGTPPRLVIHLAQGHIVVLRAPRQPAGTGDGMYPEGALPGARYRLSAPALDLCVLPKNSTATAVAVLALGMDKCLRTYMLPAEVTGAAQKKGAALSGAGAVPTAPIDAQVLEVRIP